MPASLTHMFIADDVFRLYKLHKNPHKTIMSAISKYPNYFRLGSLGPDLPYFENPITSAVTLTFDMHLKICQYGYLLHSVHPNKFVANLFSICHEFFSNKNKSVDETGEQLIAFSLGYLTHCAADIIFHNSINKHCGNYYQSDENKGLHRNAEICIDVFLFKQLYAPYYEDLLSCFTSKNFASWIDIISDSSLNSILRGWDTDLNFRVLIQRAFLNTFSTAPKEKEIEDWVDGIQLTLSKLSSDISPYTRLLTNRINPEDKSDIFTENIYDPKDYIIKMAQKIWLNDISNIKNDKIKQDIREFIQKNLPEINDSSFYSKSIFLALLLFNKSSEFISGKIDFNLFTKELPSNDLSIPGHFNFQ